MFSGAVFLQYVTAEVSDDDAFIWDVLKKEGGGDILEHLSSRLRDAREIIFAACRSNSCIGFRPRMLLRFIGPTLKADWEFYLEVVGAGIHGTIHFASDVIKDDAEVVLAVV